MHKVLLIDDDPLVRETIATVLRRRGLEIFEATNGIEGIEVAATALPDLIISDINMDGTDGFTVLETLRHDALTATIPFIIITGGNDSEGMRRGMGMGADDYLSKPFHVETLVATVEARLQRQAMLHRKLEERLETLKSRICLSLPHEVNTPLAAIMNAGELIQSGGGSMPKPNLEALGRHLVDAAGRLRRLYEQFLLYSQIECLAAIPEDVTQLRRARTLRTAPAIERIAVRQATAAKRHDDLDLQLAETAVAMLPDLFEKAVEELVDNALKFSEAHSPVRVRSYSCPHTSVLEVSDCGRGMTEKQIEEIGIFFHFQRRISSSREHGLGLTIVKRLVELHNGRFEVRSGVGKGTTVIIALPKPEGEAGNGSLPP